MRSGSKSFRPGLGPAAVYPKWVSSVSLCPEVVKKSCQPSVLEFWTSIESNPDEPEQREVWNVRLC